MQEKAKSCAIPKGSPNQTRGVIGKHIDNNGFVIIELALK